MSAHPGDKKRIALVRIEPDTVIHPLGPIYVGGALKKAGYEVRVLNIFKEEMAAAIDEVIDMKPLFVGFSTMTGQQTKHTYEISRAIRARDASIRIVWGGVHPTMLPEICLREECVDIVCLGEGEELIVELADCLSRGADLKGVGGIGYKKDNRFIVNPRRSFITDIDKYEPDWSLVENFEKCVTVLPDKRREIGFVASRGCPFNCSFCYNLKFNDRRWRKHSFEYVIQKIRYLKEKHDVGAIQFHDDNFFVDMARALAILEKLKEMDVTAASCLIRLDVLDADVLKRLIELGVKRIFVGWESGSERILKLINKNLTPEIILEKFRLISKFPDISVTAASIIGFPTERWEDICKTIDLGVKLSEIVPNIVVTFQTFMPYPGSSLYQLAIENGFAMPETMSDYDRFDTFAGRMEPTWLPWADKETRMLLWRIDKYGKLLTHSKGSNLARTIGKELFYNIGKIRLKTKCFVFPWEVGVLHHFNRYYNPKCRI